MVEISSSPLHHETEVDLLLSFASRTTQIIICLLSVLIFSFSGFLNKVLMGYVKIRIEKAHQSEPLMKLALELRQLKTELNQLSPSDQFAAYFRKDREVNKKQEEYDREKAAHDLTLPSTTKVELAVRCVLHLFATVLMWTTSHLSSFCINSSLFWPFNGLLRAPFYTLFDHEMCAEEESRVTFFIFFMLIVFVWRNLKGSK